MQKLLGFSVLGLAVALLVGGTVGCNQPAKSSSSSGATETTSAKGKDTTTKKDGGGDKTDKGEFKGHEGEVKIGKKKAEAKVSIELKDKAKADTILEVKISDSKGAAYDKITSKGATIKNGETKADITLMTGDAEAAVGEYWAEVSSDKAKNTVKIKVKVDKE